MSDLIPSGHKLIGPFKQVLTLEGIANGGPIDDEQLRIVDDGGIVVKGGRIVKVDSFDKLRKAGLQIEEVSTPSVALPGLIDAHTHLIFGGSRAHDYSLRIKGSSYQEILKQGGGIHDTVSATRTSSDKDLSALLLARLDRHLSEGVTTVEVKSGYGLSVDEELRLLRLIKQASAHFPGTIAPTCLAAHVPPRGNLSPSDYLSGIEKDVFPVLKSEALTSRIDIFVEPEAFPPVIAEPYLQAARKMGFDLTLHADQFTSGGSELAVRLGAASADHLESSNESDIRQLGMSGTAAVVLPGASLGLGMHYAPARRLLNAGSHLVIATDWNPGSAPMGDLLMQASVLAAYERLSTAETLAAITIRAAHALRLTDRGNLTEGQRADLISFPASDYREILYHQGKMKPSHVWIEGNKISTHHVSSNT